MNNDLEFVAEVLRPIVGGVIKKLKLSGRSLSLETGKHRVAVSWDPSEGALAINIYFDGEWICAFRNSLHWETKEEPIHVSEEVLNKDKDW